MSDLTDHFYVAVGELLALAAVGGLQVELELVDGRIVTGVPLPARDGDERYADTGSPTTIRFPWQAVALADVECATVCRPKP